MLRAVLFDLDDTLMPDLAAAEQAMVATAKLAAEWHRIMPAELKESVRRVARQLWRAHPIVAQYEGHFDISSWEALVSRFDGSDPEMAELRNWAPEYRQQVWTTALAEFGVADPLLTDLLECTYQAERRSRYQPYPDALPLLEQLRSEYRLGLVTNGPADLQREKLRRSGLEGRFGSVVISREVGMMKPEPRIFRIALEQLGVGPSDAVMVGDSIWHDVAGAHAAGIQSVWVNYDSRSGPDGEAPDATIHSLSELPAALRLFIRV